jgi:hypothetical protein
MKLKLPSEKEKFKFYFDKLQDYEGVIELRKVMKPRTIQQNKFLHVLITLFAIECGYTLDEAKTLLKRQCDFMIYEKKGKTFLKRTRDLSVSELAEFITWIRNYAGMNEIYLPSSDDYLRNWQEIEKTIEQNRTYL